jgi:hypothetical protein
LARNHIRKQPLPTQSACCCGIVSVKLFGYDDEPLAEIVFQPPEWVDFVGRLKLVHLHS